jgi:hypothetical protein
VEHVIDARSYHLEVAHRLVEPAERAPQDAIDVLDRLLHRLAGGFAARAQRCDCSRSCSRSDGVSVSGWADVLAIDTVSIARIL